MRKKLSMTVCSILIISTVFVIIVSAIEINRAVETIKRNKAYETLLADGWSEKVIEAMNLKWLVYSGISLTDYMQSETVVDLSKTAFASFYDYTDDFNTCASFIKELVDNGAVKDGDSVWFYPDSIVLHRRTGDKYSTGLIKPTSPQTPAARSFRVSIGCMISFHP